MPSSPSLPSSTHLPQLSLTSSNSNENLETVLTTPNVLSSYFNPVIDSDQDHRQDDAFVPLPTSPLASFSLNDSDKSQQISNTNKPTLCEVKPKTDAESSSRPSLASASVASVSSSLGPVIVISGGSGWNDLVNSTPPNTTHCLPVSDDGGSSSEIIRVLGGPSIGDLRSRLVRLIPLPSTDNLNSSSNHSNSHSSDTASFNLQVPIPSSNYAVHQLLSYRLPAKGQSKVIKQEWLEILEGKHKLWKGIEPERKEVIRGFLVQFQSEVLRRSHRNFEFRGMSVGNAFLAASQKFFRSIQSAIFLFSVTTQMHLSSSKVLPIINTNHTATIAAELENDEIVVGQCEISHPIRNDRQTSETKVSSFTTPNSQENTWNWNTNATFNSDSNANSSSSTFPGTPASQIFDPFSNPNNYLEVSGRLETRRSQPINNRLQSSPSLLAVGNSGDGLDPEQQDDEDDEDLDDGLVFESGAATSIGETSRALIENKNGKKKDEARGNVAFDKNFSEEENQLGARIKRIFYVNAYRHEVFPRPNPEVITCLSQSKTLIYSCGSLYTSIMPCLVLRGIATSIAKSSNLKAKVLLLNTLHDRETRGLDAVDFLKVITDSLNRSDSPPILDKNGNLTNQFPKALYETKDFITHLIYFEEGEIKVDLDKIKQMGIICVKAIPTSKIEPDVNGKLKPPIFEEESVKKALETVAEDTK